MRGYAVSAEPGANLDQSRSFARELDLRMKGAPGQAQGKQPCPDTVVDFVFAQRCVRGRLAMANLTGETPGNRNLSVMATM